MKEEETSQAALGNADTWPVLAPAALQGLAGEIVQAIEPYTEADPVAVLVHVLTAFGNLVGSEPHFLVEFTKHPPRISPVLVGKTSKARKGQAWSTPRRMFEEVDSVWVRERVTSGLSSGEGLIYAARDAGVERQPLRRGKGGIEYDDVGADPGVLDKRLLVVEEEFSQALKVMDRAGNILSPTIRQAWDSGDLHPLTKHNPIRATGAHISIIGHITRDELLRYLTQTEQGNGFANRFIWVLVKRSKVIPNPTGVPDDVLKPLIVKLRTALAFARSAMLINRDDEAEERWKDVYPDLSEGQPGLLGAIIARAEAQVMRLALIYALLDSSPEIRLPHLEAALALWDYSEASVRQVFGDRLGNPTADRILTAIRGRGGLTETEIRDLFQRNKTAREIEEAIDFLYERELIFSDRVRTEGRPRTVWKLTTKTTKGGLRSFRSFMS